MSDLIENRNRGILAEFLVMKALHIQQKTRLEWDAYDLLTPNGIKVEVKSAAYFQSWKQKAKSTISFSIAPKLITDSTTNTPISKRLADVYVFCLLNVSDSETLINPMDMEQWTFFIVKTEELNQKRSNQKTLRLTTLKTLRHIECNYAHLKESLIKTTTLPC
ncbi:hypothetical protein [Spirulina subsalsa]|uniref:hypothetical protein n=1 Tax=Spirulina subsalsa TaxID=54311 RepID=UPI0013E00DE9|nr:hypothetical protein [Spirulina subsalsa]